MMLFSLERGVNIHVWLHLCLLGIGVCLWVRAMGRHPFACFCAGAAGMFCGPVFLHVYAGHLVNIAAMAWAPWLLLGTQLAADGRLTRGGMIGAFALAMQLLTGQAQYVYYTCIAVGIYSLVRLVDVKRRVLFLVTMAALVAGALVLTAVQLMPGLAGLGETARGGKGTGFEFAAMFSFPPENLLTLVVPGFFGNMTGQIYWGRCYLWEMSLFIGVAGLVLAMFGFFAAELRVRRAMGVTICVLFILALGSHTPLFPILYKHAPGFSSLRGNCKFTFPCALFVLAFVGLGVDALMRNERTRKAGMAAIAGAVVCGLAAMVVFVMGEGAAWRGLMEFIRDTRESYLQPQLFGSAEFGVNAAQFAAKGLLIAALTLAAIGAVLISNLKPATRAAAIGLLAITEVLVFAWNARVTFNLDQYREVTGQGEIIKYLAAHPGDQRVLQVAEPNAGLHTGAQNIWGYGAIPQRRYLEFMAWTQGVDPDKTTQYVNFQRLDPLYAMLRLRGVLVPNGRELRVIDAPAAPMGRVQLISNYRVLPGRDAIFNMMRTASFDPRAEVLLEREPEPRPVQSDDPGTVKITSSSNDWLEIEADVKSPAILLVTDPYAPSWRATALPGSAQQKYEVLPANYILRALPLGAGHHKLRMEYVPAGFALGKWISVTAWLALFGWTGTMLVGDKKKRLAAERAQEA
jgi:hypothetical protein